MAGARRARRRPRQHSQSACRRRPAVCARFRQKCSGSLFPAWLLTCMVPTQGLCPPPAAPATARRWHMRALHSAQASEGRRFKPRVVNSLLRDCMRGTQRCACARTPQKRGRTKASSCCAASRGHAHNVRNAHWPQWHGRCTESTSSFSCSLRSPAYVHSSSLPRDPAQSATPSGLSFRWDASLWFIGGGRLFMRGGPQALGPAAGSACHVPPLGWRPTRQCHRAMRCSAWPWIACQSASSASPSAGSPANAPRGRRRALRPWQRM